MMFWIDIEQLGRGRERNAKEGTPLKKWKLNSASQRWLMTSQDANDLLGLLSGDMGVRPTKTAQEVHDAIIKALHEEADPSIDVTRLMIRDWWSRVRDSVKRWWESHSKK